MADTVFERALREALAEFGVVASDEAVARMSAHYELLVTWNRRMNLTRITGPREAATLHFAESAYAGRFLDSRVRRILDVGSGAGFPGLPLAVLFPNRQVVLVESVGKKCTFLREAVEAMGLGNVRVAQSRFAPEHVGPGDAIVARAVDKFSMLLPALMSSSATQLILYAGEDLLTQADSFDRGRGRRHSIPGFDRRFLGVYGTRTKGS